MTLILFPFIFFFSIMEKMGMILFSEGIKLLCIGFSMFLSALFKAKKNVGISFFGKENSLLNKMGVLEWRIIDFDDFAPAEY